MLDTFKEDPYPLVAVFNYCLNNFKPFFEKPFSWRPIITALKSKAIGESGLAERIVKKYCPSEKQITADSYQEG